MIVRYRYLEKNNFLINKNFLALKKFLINGQYISDQIRINFEKKIVNFLDSAKNIINNCINITDDNMYNGLIKKFKIFDK